MEHNSAGTSPATSRASTPHIAILGTGGTIACTTADNGDLVPTLSIAEVIERTGLHDLAAQYNITVTSEDVMSLDSSAIQLQDVDTLIGHVRACVDNARNNNVRLLGVIVVHGTDSMEETAMAMDQIIGAHVPIVLTGAQRAADHPNADGPSNLRQAVDFFVRSVPLDSTPTSPRPHVVFGGQVLPAFGVFKSHTTADAGFSNTFTEAAEAEGRALPEYVAEVNQRLAFTGSSAEGAWAEAEEALPQLSGFNVPIVEAYAGADGQLIRALIASGQPIHGIVVAAMGSGNVPPLLVEALEEAQVPTVICSRVPSGGVHFVYGGTGGGAQLERLGMFSGEALRPSQARIALIAHLAQHG